MKSKASWAAIIIIIALWQVSFEYFQWKAWVFPAPTHVLHSLLSLLNLDPSKFGNATWAQIAESFAKSPLIFAQLVSMYRLIAGYILASGVGAFFGILMWRFKSVNDFLGPLFLGIQTLPSVCWVPLGILMVGINEIGILFVLVVGSFCTVSIALRDGLSNLSPIYAQAGWMLGAKRWTLYRYVLIPASLPALSNSLRQGFTFCWRSLMGAELLFMVERKGLGFLLATGRDLADVAQVVTIMAMMILTGTLVDSFIFARLEQRVRTRFGVATTRSDL
jgi:NitT/TauT family transport system permease protein